MRKRAGVRLPTNQSRQRSIVACERPLGTAPFLFKDRPAAAQQLIQRASIFDLTNSWNQVDSQRIDDVGPDYAAAEWVLRCAGSVRFARSPRWLSDYNALAGLTGPAQLIGIDTTGSCVNDLGFGHIRGLKHLQTIKLNKNHLITNRTIEQLEPAKGSLRSVQVTTCGNITDDGLMALAKLTSLTDILVAGLPEVSNMDKCVSALKRSLPKCTIRVM